MKKNVKCLSALCLMLACSSTVVLSAVSKAKKPATKKPMAIGSARARKNASESLRSAIRKNLAKNAIQEKYDSYMDLIEVRYDQASEHDSLLRAFPAKKELIVSLKDTYAPAITRKSGKQQQKLEQEMSSQLDILEGILAKSPYADKKTYDADVKAHQKALDAINEIANEAKSQKVDFSNSILKRADALVAKGAPQLKGKDKPKDEFAGLSKDELAAKLKEIVAKSKQIDFADKSATTEMLARVNNAKTAAEKAGISDTDVKASGIVGRVKVLNSKLK